MSKTKQLRSEEFQQLQSTICHNIKMLRLQKSFTQKHVADYLGIDRTTYTYYELDRICPNIFVLTRIADLYSVSLDSIISGSKQ